MLAGHAEEHAHGEVAPQGLGLVVECLEQQPCGLALQADGHCQAVAPELVPHAQELRVLLRVHGRMVLPLAAKETSVILPARVIQRTRSLSPFEQS